MGAKISINGSQKEKGARRFTKFYKVARNDLSHQNKTGCVTQNALSDWQFHIHPQIEKGLFENILGSH
mgnify:CR=1 FL=1